MAWERGENRANIQRSANCVPPLDKKLAEKMGLRINCNFGEMMQLLSHARRSYRNACYLSQHFFKVSLPYAPSQYQADWGLFITDEINRKMHESEKFFGVQESLFTAIVTHGVGPRLWYDKFKWCPDYVALSDLRIPTDTDCDLENLEDGWFAVKHVYTPGELIKKALAPGRKWAKKEIGDILKSKKNSNWDYAAEHYDWDSQPEKFVELLKQNGGFYESDAMPGFPMWHFYFADYSDDANGGWFMVVVPAEGTIGAPKDTFLWKSDKAVAKKRSQLLNLQFGDLSNDAPVKVWSVRSLGFALLEPTFYTNLARCRMLQHLMDQFNVWLRSNDPPDKARKQMQEFGNFNVIGQGLSVVPQAERHQVNPALIEMAMGQLKQLMQEASASYTQSSDSGTQREQTAFETSVKLEQVNAMLGGLLMKFFITEKFFHQEIGRRYCIPDSEDEDVKDFQEKCEKAGIPRQFIDVKQWQIEEVTPLGMGNPTLARAAAKELIEILPLADPTAQQEMKHEIFLAVTQDPRKAARWAPLGKGRGITDGARDAMSMFGTLMQGVPVPSREGLPAIDQIEAMLPLLAGKIHLATQRDNMATPDELQGFQAVLQYIGQLVQQVAQNKNEKQRVKQYGDAIGKLTNEVKGLAQRAAQAKAKQNGNGQDPAAAAKIQAMMMQAQVKAKTTADKAKQAQKLKDEAHVRDQRRADANAFAEIERQEQITKAKVKHKSTEE